eukprot:4133144-Pyramimonas_sp.AAC.1
MSGKWHLRRDRAHLARGLRGGRGRDGHFSLDRHVLWPVPVLFLSCLPRGRLHIATGWAHETHA